MMNTMGKAQLATFSGGKAKERPKLIPEDNWSAYPAERTSIYSSEDPSPSTPMFDLNNLSELEVSAMFTKMLVSILNHILSNSSPFLT